MERTHWHIGRTTIQHQHFFEDAPKSFTEHQWWPAAQRSSAWWKSKLWRDTTRRRCPSSINWQSESDWWHREATTGQHLSRIYVPTTGRSRLSVMKVSCWAGAPAMKWGHSICLTWEEYVQILWPVVASLKWALLRSFQIWAKQASQQTFSHSA